MATRNLALRILYTINSSPQYILARSFSPIVATLVGEAPYQYATAPLKACLDAICRSSPELIQDCSRDYSIYVLDPLESNTAPTPISISSGAASSSNATGNAQSQAPRGVAVGLGLMSWALADGSDTVQATGTLIRLPTGQDAVEVIFALRETTATQKAPQPPSTSGSAWGASSSLHPSNHQINAVASSSRTVLSASHHGPSPAPNDARTLATIASIQMRSQSKRPRSKKPSQRPDAPSSEADKLLLAQDVYIGPVRKKGRPVRSISTASFTEDTKGQGNSGLGGASTDHASPVHPGNSSQSVTSGPSIQEILSLLASTTAQVSDPAQTTALSAALGSIDASSGSNTSDSSHNPDLVSALKTLLGAVSQQQAAPPQAEPQNARPTRPRSPDDEIIVLDKENVNPTAFRKRVLDGKPLAASNSSQEENNRDRKLSNRSNTQPDPPPPSSSTMSTTSSIGRKRTLSDFMDEREASRERQKLTSLMDKRDAHRLAHSTRLSAESSVHRYYPRVAGGDAPRASGSNSYYRTAIDCTTSPLKASGSFTSSFRSQNSENANPFSHRALLSSPTRPTRVVSASSPVRPVAAKARKPYVVPAWARTGTATQPRLSEQAQRALEEQEKRKKEERAQRKAIKASAERETKRRCARTPSPEPPSSSQDNYAPTLMQPPQTPKRASKPTPAPVPAMSYPVFASSSPGTTASLFRTPSTPKRQTPLRPTPRMVSFPVTPKRRAASVFGSPSGDDSLFTPGALFTPKTPSMAALRASCSPTRPRAKNPDTHGSDGDVEDELDRELDSAMEELTSSQVTSESGDDDQSIDEDYIPSSSELSTSTASTAGTCTPVRSVTPPPKEHWEGLPPSSPIPPSSPMQIPQDLDDSDDEDRELPVATSEAEPDTFFSNSNSEANTPSYPESPLPTSQSEQEQSTAESAIDGQDYDLFPAFAVQQGAGEMLAFNSDSSFFDAFSDPNLGLQFNEEDFGAIPEDLLQGLTAEHDLTQFLESCKSLAGMCQNNGDTGNPEAAASLESLFQNIDHEKLAEELQGLYSGCVV